MRHLPYKSIFIVLSFLFLSNFAFGQTTIKGEVLDERNNDPLIGANVLIKGTSIGTKTDYDGSFVIKTDLDFPLTIVVSYLGYTEKEIALTDASEKLNLKLSESAIVTDVVEVTEKRLSDKQKQSPLTVESMDFIAIKETPAANFYDGLGSLKGVDLTTASLGFTIVNTRGFNSTSPVRSLQIIDGVDNQSPGLNFSLGNFLGSPELDVLKVDLIVGASSAYYGPNAFNGVISMKSRNPFLHKGLSVMAKAGERNLYEMAFRYADAIKNKDGVDKFAYKINFAYLQANDWEATNYDPSYQSDVGLDNPGGYDAVNIYGDENTDRSRDFLTSPSLRFDFPGLGVFHRRGYREVELVDYNTRNIKANLALHYKITDDVELIGGVNYGEGTTVYQGENRFSLKGIQFFQGKIELQKPNKFFIRTYMTTEDAGESYDAYFTALLLQNASKTNSGWTSNYSTYFRNTYKDRIEAFEGYPTGIPFDFETQAIVLAQNQDSLIAWHLETQNFVNQNDNPTYGSPFLEPGTPEFEAEFNRITSTLPSDTINPGTRFYDKSDLYHVHGEYKFTPLFGDIIVGANYRQYTPDSRGTIFLDTMGRKISNWEYGVYGGLEMKFAQNQLKLNLTGRMDKNQNFDYLFSPAASLVYTPNENHYLRVSFSSAIRNPTLTDQYLYYNVGRAILLGNANGVDSIVTIESLLDYFETLNPDTLVYFNEPGIQPEKVKTFEIGYRATLFDKIWVDAGYYYSFYDDFIGYKFAAAVETSPFPPFLPISVQPYRIAANAQNRVTTQGFSIGLNYYFPKYFVLAGNYSWNILNKKGTDDPIIPAFNTPEHKYNISLSGRDLVINIGSTSIRNLGFNVNYKWVQGFLFEGSPQFTGEIPTYDLLDAQLNYKFKKLKTILKIGASNVPNKKQFQVYGGPRVGRMAYISLLYEWNKNN